MMFVSVIVCTGEAMGFGRVHLTCFYNNTLSFELWLNSSTFMLPMAFAGGSHVIIAHGVRASRCHVRVRHILVCLTRRVNTLSFTATLILREVPVIVCTLFEPFARESGWINVGICHFTVVVNFVPFR